MRKLIYSLVAFVVALNLVSLTPAFAQGDVEIVCSAPAADETVEVLPESVSLTVSSDVSSAFVFVSNEESGARVDADGNMPDIDGATVTVELRTETSETVLTAVEAGATYEVLALVTTDDGRTRLTYTFSVSEDAEEVGAAEGDCETEEPTEEPTEEVVEEPTEEVDEEPTAEVVEEPTEEVAEEPTEEPTEEVEPTEEPTEEVEPTEEPTDEPTEVAVQPTEEPTEEVEPTEEPTEEVEPTEEPTEEVVEEPTEEVEPTVEEPTAEPTEEVAEDAGDEEEEDDDDDGGIPALLIVVVVIAIAAGVLIYRRNRASQV